MALVTCVATAASALDYSGVNLAGAEFGESQLPGTYGSNYTYPSSAEIDYYLDVGLDTFRVPFRWERLQRAPFGALDAGESARLSGVVAYATGHGARVILDPHNYARYSGALVGSGSLPNSAFADFWSRVAAQYKSNPRVIFGLMNEPHDMPTEQWVAAANAAIAAIRAAGAQNLILVPGNAWTGAHSWSDSWYGTPNATAMLNIVDPSHNFAFEVHQYLDADSSGTSAGVAGATIGSQRLAGFTQWCRSHGYRALLGEFAVAGAAIGTGSSQIGDEALGDMLDYMQQNADVWLGWTWWAGGPWWGDYMFTLEPQNLGQPTETGRPQLAVLRVHLLPEPGSALWLGAIAVALLHRRRSAR
ncbi:MAG: glycoside hydrolase family 5 protein [Deltaproteobacteria bacterium]|nr:MAG: glycoside hydrolase family 5 protein [Deltaproteobacteria bacterium]